MRQRHENCDSNLELLKQYKPREKSRKNFYHVYFIKYAIYKLPK